MPAARRSLARVHREAQGDHFDMILVADLVMAVRSLMTGLWHSPCHECEHRQRCLRNRLQRDGLLHAV